MIVDVRDECKVGAVRGPWSRRPRIAADRALRLGEVDDFLHATVQVDQSDVVVKADACGEGDRFSVGSPRNLRHDIVHVRELLRLAALRVDDEHVVAVPIPV